MELGAQLNSNGIYHLNVELIRAADNSVNFLFRPFHVPARLITIFQFPRKPAKKEKEETKKRETWRWFSRLARETRSDGVIRRRNTHGEVVD